MFRHTKVSFGSFLLSFFLSFLVLSSSKAGRKQVETKALDKQRWLLGANLFNGKVLIGCLVAFPKLVLIPHPRFMLACFAAFPTTRYVTIILVARLERSRTTPSHGREKRRTIQGWLTNRAVASSCFFRFANLVLSACSVLECFSARFVSFLFFFLFSLSSLSFALYLLLAEVFRAFFLHLLADVMPFPMLLCGWLYVADVEGFLFFLWPKRKVSKADVLAKGGKGEAMTPS